jgi:tRNA(Ser,Leu) C12 N-acetylase TAN1
MSREQSEQGVRTVKEWNVLVTTPPGEERELLPALNRLGIFVRSEFKGILRGWVENGEQFLEAILHARNERAGWLQYLIRVLPVERTFPFTVETFEEQVWTNVTPLVQRMTSGTFHVRLERRGYKGKIISPEVEQRLGEYVIEIAKQQGKTLRVSFHDSDYVVVVETVGNRGGVALITRDLSARYPFVKIR